ncbi:DUF4268 domain-containing protein [Pseudohoeflea suaedae]|uniref:DUF4268 domain-containing protein n=1 Tax=Pseudohoeflea suaedae TaxID=877384 RepID=UPI001FCF0443|nr:DUF4268 domain-containing protein [Pseudohoeflea suaedae]
MSYPIGRSGFGVNAAMVRPKRQLRAELYISNPDAKAFYHLLNKQKLAIETELGYLLDWEELPEGRDTRISISLGNCNPEDRNDWPRQHNWLGERLNEFHAVFARRVKLLDPDTWVPDVSQGAEERAV